MPRSPTRLRRTRTLIGAPGTGPTPPRPRRGHRGRARGVVRSRACSWRPRGRGCLLERAVALTPDPEAPRTARARGGARGALGRRRRRRFPLLRAARLGPLDKLESAQRQLLEGEIAYGSRRVGDAPSLLVAAARRLGRWTPGWLARRTSRRAGRRASRCTSPVRADNSTSRSRPARRRPPLELRAPRT